MFNLRYSREIILKEISEDGFKKIRNSSVCIVGLGSTGSPCADLLVRSGIGSLRIIDGDTVDVTNLHRQIIFSEEDVGVKKVYAAEKRLTKINSDCKIFAIPDYLTEDNVSRLLSGTDLVVDGTDNMESRRIINRYCVTTGEPWIFISSIGTVAQVKAIVPGKTSCLDCFVAPSDNFAMSCEDTGVLASAPIIASSKAWTIAVKILTGKEVNGDLNFIDPWNEVDENIGINRNPECPVCSRFA